MTVVADIAEFLMIYVAFVFVAKYVFMENRIEGKRRYIFHGIAAIGIVVFMFINSIFVDVWLGIMSGLYILFERKTYRIIKALLAIPILGVVTGLMMPFSAMLDVMFEADMLVDCVVKIILYALVIVFLTLVQIRIDSGKEMSLGSSMSFMTQGRQLSKFEKTALILVGVFEFLFARIMFLSASSFWDIEKSQAEVVFKVIIWLFGASTFISTFVLVSVVLAGNKRSFFYDKVSDMQYNIIVTMAEIVENRDSNTGGHIQRTARYVDIIAKQLRRNSPYSELMTDQFIHDLSVAAPLHDIGKIHVPDAILNFPGRLSDEQFAIMRTHAAEGKKLLQHSRSHLGNFSYLEMAIDMAGCHHEWWDGSSKGYPDQLKGEEIPLCARIMAVADVFDALTARRVYKEPMPIQTAMDIITSERGTHFDPVVVDAFVDAKNSISEALEEFSRVEIEEMRLAE